MRSQKLLQRCCFWACLLALLVVGLGAFTRLMDAGLGCPDWPGCYGQWRVPQTPAAIAQLTNLYPNTPFVAAKAWAEMVHRYFAGLLILFIIAILMGLYRQGQWRLHAGVRRASIALLLLVLYQPLLGWWTVRYKLLPIVVSQHLLGGMALASLLWFLYLQQRPRAHPFIVETAQRVAFRRFRRASLLGVVLLGLQIALGAWTSTHYAAIACPDFPLCAADFHFLREHAFKAAFQWVTSSAAPYDFSSFSEAVKRTIQMTHRVGALVVSVYWCGLCGFAMLRFSKNKSVALWSLAVLSLLALQVALGILNVVLARPLAIAVLHNGVGAGLLLTAIGFTQLLSCARTPEGKVIPGWFAHCRDYFDLCKPRVVALMLLTAMVGMLMTPLDAFAWGPFVAGNVGIALAAASAATLNHWVDLRIDRLMLRTQHRPLVEGRVGPAQSLWFAGVLCGLAMLILLVFVNALTALLTFLTLVAYAGVYTMYLKHATPQNIVIGGIAGAAPPLLGWVAMTGHVSAPPLLLVLIIFVWTPAHFWALAIHRVEEYRAASVPMLPNTHGVAFTQLHVLLYTLLLFAVTLLPFSIGMSGWIYLGAALLLNARFLQHAIQLFKAPQAQVAVKTFRYSIVYLMLLFVALLVDHFFIQ